MLTQIIRTSAYHAGQSFFTRTILAIILTVAGCGTEPDCLEAQPSACTPISNGGQGLQGSGLTMASGSPTRAYGPDTWHVAGDASTGGTGLTWASALNSLQSALDLAERGDSIWLKQGVYTPNALSDSQDPRSVTFNIPNGVKLFGGFVGDETEVSERNTDPSLTVLSGNIGDPGVPTDNAYHVVQVQGGAGSEERPRRFTGLTIAGGYADGPAHSRGAALRVEGAMAYLYNVVVRDHYTRKGGAIRATGADLRVSGSRFENNETEGKGGALFIQGAQAWIGNTVFAHNRARKGGAVYVHSIGEVLSGDAPMVSFINTLMHNNWASQSGGALYLNGSENLGAGRATLTNCTLTENEAGNRGGAIHARTGTPIAAESIIANSIVTNNVAPVGPDLSGRHLVSYSNISSVTAAGTNISENPHFVDPDAGNYRLRHSSPSVDRGNNDALGYDLLDFDGDGDRLESPPVDLDDNPRVVAAHQAQRYPDMGAYETSIP
jgi:hypothetical protein